MKVFKTASMIVFLTLAVSLNADYRSSNEISNIENDFSIKKVYKTPTVLEKRSKLPAIFDDMDFKNLQLSINRQMKKFFRINFSSKIQLGKQTYSSKVIPASLLAFQEIMSEAKDCLALEEDRNACYDTFGAALKRDFNFYRPKDQSAKKGSLFTGYYTPTLRASTEKSEAYPWGIYSKPTDASQASLNRTQIDFHRKLDGTGYDSFFTDDLYGNYLLHIEGGGRLELRDASGEKYYQYITYDGTNKQSFRFIFRYMQDKGYIESPSIKSQRNFLDANPEKWEEIYSYCPSYVFFKASDHPPYGNEGTSLTNGRSIATDRKLYRLKGLLAFIDSPKPRSYDDNGNVVKTNSSRFFVDHDTGGAIKGSARADLFYGEDDEATFMASYTYDRGTMHFLALKPHKIDMWYKIFDKLRKYKRK